MIQEGAQTNQLDTIDIVSVRPVTVTETIPTTGVRLLMPGVDLYGSIADLAETRRNRESFSIHRYSHIRWESRNLLKVNILQSDKHPASGHDLAIAYPQSPARLGSQCQVAI